MELDLIKRVYFMGAGGIGMSALARYFKNRGCAVYGYDKTRTTLTIALETEGILLNYNDDLTALPEGIEEPAEDLLIVYTPAIPKNSVLLNFFKDRGFDLQKRSQVLGLISKGQFCIAVAGTHGKTTTSSVIAHILTDSGFGCTAFLGGIATNYQTNFLLGNNHVVVVEADEYDRSFLTLHPDIAVITSMDADHLDIYGDAAQLHESFYLFAGQLKEKGQLYYREGLPLSNGETYAASETADICAKNIRVENGRFVFDYQQGDFRIDQIEIQLPGRHNVENITASIAVALKLGISPELVKQALRNFKGVKRRFETIIRTESHVYIDDYAHHPEELRACFHAVRELYPGQKLTVVFQPHLFTRTRDFAAGFAEVLSSVDELLLLDIYPARELPLEGINSAYLLDKITLENSAVYTMAEVLDYVGNEKPALLLTVGAGNIDTLVQPLKDIMENA
ncbi:UDP-N-acetylmuramate--L-alanine ligase [Pedobacter antarcticus]|uniref:UDP-N-acetylmuramate--L-alanine ligase n=1 Tax=Pedobacter antarcticus TaxID=34086 RepID=UPI00292F2922|nr:UDP-N-acetylmuramate--L-alanine ligase [Pedobacter antarcticus]